MSRRVGLDRALVLAGAVVIAGVFGSRTLLAQARADGEKGRGAMDHGAMGMMMDCPMMSAAMQGPGAAVERREELGLTDAQVGQLEALRARDKQAQSDAMERMVTLHKELSALSAATRFDEAAARSALTRMGALHTDMGLSVLRAAHDVRALLTSEQRKTFAARSGGMGGMMDMMGGGMMSMRGCPMMPMMDHDMTKKDPPGPTATPGKSQGNLQKPKATTTPPAMDHHGHKPPPS